MRKSIVGNIQDIVTVIATFLIIGVILFPFFWMIVSSFKPSSELLSRNIEFISSQMTGINYKKIFEVGFLRNILNSILVCTTATIVCVGFIASPAAYAISRCKFPRKGSIMSMIGFTQMFPWIVLVTPVFMIFWALHFTNSYVGLIIVYIAITAPFSIYMLVAYFETIPKELDNAAAIDGCSKLGIIFRIALPISLPGLVATATYIFALTWSEFLFALTLMVQSEKKTVPVGIADFFGQYSADWGKVMAASVVAAIPTVIFFTIMQRYLIKGLVAGSVKQ